MPKRRDQELLRAVGQRVARMRRDGGFTQEQLAEAIEIQPVTLSRLETGDRALSLSTLARISEALNVGLGDLLDVERDVPARDVPPEEAEVVRLFRTLPPGQKDVVLRLLRDLSS